LKKIECIIRQNQLDKLLTVLRQSGIGGITVTAVQGFGVQRVLPEPYLIPKAKIEIYALESEVQNIIETISVAVSTGRIGDGKIAILPVDDVIRIRTGEKGAKALV
jgi:nitrogen regulatory protein P-II 1